MAFLNRAAPIGSEGLTAATSFGATYYVGLVLLGIIMVVVLVYAYRVWEEIHDVEEPDSPSNCWIRSSRRMPKATWMLRNVDRLRKILGRTGLGPERSEPMPPDTPTPTVATIEDPRALGGTEAEGPTEGDVSQGSR